MTDDPLYCNCKHPRIGSKGPIDKSDNCYNCGGKMAIYIDMSIYSDTDIDIKLGKLPKKETYISPFSGREM